MEFVGDETEEMEVNGIRFGLNLDTFLIDHSDKSYMDVISNARLSRQPGWWKE